MSRALPDVLNDSGHYLFSGIFNPVYGEARDMLPLGLALGMATRLGQTSRPQRAGAAP